VADRLRFHLDEHVDPEVAAGLRRHGIDVTTTADAGLRGASDAEQLDYVRREGRVIVTDDADFLRLAAGDTDHPGIAVPRLATHSIGEIIRWLIVLYEVMTPEEMRSHVEYIW
jgi:predicted nuclease of predicted toxin-antitoxin system